jgi:alpha-glucoside transport system substrate-binding protein
VVLIWHGVGPCSTYVRKESNQMTVRVGRTAAAVAGIAAFSLVLAACGGDDGGGAEETDAAGGGDAAASEYEIDCSVYEQFGDLQGTTVTTFAGIGDPESGYYEESWAPFEECTGVDVQPEWSQDFEAQIVVRVQSGSAPDIAILPQPGLLATLVRDTGAVLPGFEEVEALVDENWAPAWKEYGSVDGTFYAAPNSSNSKSFAWYSPSAFEEAGYEVPKTWEDMIALSDQIVADNPDGSVKPWCAGIESGVATGWPTTDWMEDVMLREYGPDVYDQWVAHEIPFNGEEVGAVLEKVGTILKNEDYVNGGFGGVQTIATTEFQEGGIPITQGNCYMHRQASFYINFWPEGTTIAEDGDVFAFYFPANEGSTENPVLVGSEFITAFDDRPEVRAFATYLATSDYANVRAQVPGEAGGFVSANLGLDIDNLANPIDKLAAEQFQDPEAVIRFDGSDLMPAAVGSGSFWTEMTNWIANDKPNQDVLDAIENSWPS